jgi:hypothetical protein
MMISYLLPSCVLFAVLIRAFNAGRKGCEFERRRGAANHGGREGSSRMEQQ